jgi:hypothetical protein
VNCLDGEVFAVEGEVLLAEMIQSGGIGVWAPAGIGVALGGNGSMADEYGGKACGEFKFIAIAVAALRGGYFNAVAGRVRGCSGAWRRRRWGIH